jgi:hypothetical protein
MIRPDFRRDAEIGAQKSRAQFVTSLVTNLGVQSPAATLE